MKKILMYEQIPVDRSYIGPSGERCETLEALREAWLRLVSEPQRFVANYILNTHKVDLTKNPERE